jgi:phosphohistidine phosphatase
MWLYVMRHGPAEDRSVTGSDFDRTLTREGRAVVERAARALRRARSAHADPRPCRVLSSPLRRARETADLVRAALDLPEAWPTVEVHDELAADADIPLPLVQAVAGDGADALLVGHQPIVEALVRQLVHPAHPALPRGFRTALIAALARDGALGWRLDAVVDPHVLPP